MATRKKLVNDFAAFMILVIVGSLIAGSIEGINIGRNVQRYNTYYEEVDPQDYLVFNFEIKEAARMYLYCNAENTSIYNNDANVIFAIMRSSSEREVKTSNTCEFSASFSATLSLSFGSVKIVKIAVSSFTPALVGLMTVVYFFIMPCCSIFFIRS